ncbi:MAG TPA: fatty acid desaturase [Bacteroidia bacterium]|nr:fatty acid desaturase [Bacteroidia bacterium]
MREGKELILATKIYAKEDRSKSWFHMGTTFICLVIAYAGGIFPSHWLIQLAFGTLSGLLLARAFIIYHDYLHNTILQHSTIAKLIFTWFGWHMLAPISVWKRSHDYHHAHNSKLYSSSIGSFPIVTKKKYLEASRKDQLIYLFIRHPLTILCGYFFSFAYGMCIRTLIRSSEKHLDAIWSLIYHYGSIAVLGYFLGWESAVLGFLLPSLIAGAMGSYLFYAQHNFPGATFKDAGEWTYIDAALESSSYMKMGPVMNWFTGNIGYHHIHHTNSKIPFYNLPKVYKEMEEFRIHARETSLKPWDMAKCLRLKVWDPEAGRMIGLKEIHKPLKKLELQTVEI